MMHLKLLGAGLILSASFWTGLRIARILRRSARQLTELTSALDLLECEIRFMRTGCGEVFLSLSERFSEQICVFFRLLSEAFSGEGQTGPGLTERCLRTSALCLPRDAALSLQRLFDGFGVYDLDGQLRLISAVRAELGRSESVVREQLEGRCRTYEALSLCTGAALMILVI